MKFRLFDNLGNLCDDQFKSKKQVLKAIGEYLVNTPTRQDPTLCAIKEKEGVFDFVEAENEVNAMLE